MARNGRRGGSRERGEHRSRGERSAEVCTAKCSRSRTTLSEQTSRPSTADAEEEAKKARQARVEAWKKKQLLKKGVASPAAANSGAASPALDSPAAEASKAHTQDGADDEDDNAAPLRKFDHKAIAKRAAAAMDREKQKTALGGDITIPKSATHAPVVDAHKPANQPKAMYSNVANGNNAIATHDLSHKLICESGAPANSSSGKIGGFGLSTATAETKDKSAVAKTAAPLGDEEEVERKLEKLPDISMQADTGDAALANDSDDQDESNDIRSDEDEAEAVREAAQKRAEQAQANQDVAMTDAQANQDEDGMDEDEEIDPLDAFMNGLEQPSTNNKPNLAIGKTKKSEPQVFDSDDEGGNLDAVGDDTEAVIAAAAAKKKRKELPPVDHAKMNYEPFRKDFYSESVELADMTAEDVEILRSDLDNIKCRGANVPKPIVKWSQGGFGTQILDVIREQKFEKPTSIQAQALPAIMSGRDVIGVAKTGSGKTMAFILPMFRHIKDQRPLSNLEGPIGVILAPTRELAVQIHRDCKPYLKALNLRAVCCYGGAPIKDQIAELKRGTEIIVCTAGRMIDLLTANSGRVLSLARTTYVVLDEADRMFDMGFEPQITRILNRIRPQRQTVLFSATFPKNMEALARKALTKPIEIIVGGRSVVAPEITQIIEVHEEKTKFNRALHLLGDLLATNDDARCLIFVERQEMADSLLKELFKAGYPADTIHGGREQIDRDQAINDFKAGIFPVLIATSVAARGLDVKQLKLVINYDSPNHVEDYVHRSGRTGRAGNTGTAVTFVTPEQERFAPFLIRALKDSKQEIPEPLAKLAQSHEEKVKSGQAQKLSSGFGGRGVERLDAARDAEKAVMKKQYKTEDEPEDEEEDEKDGKKNSEVEKLLAKAVSGVKERDAAPEQSEETPAGLDPKLDDHLKRAMKVQKADPPAPKATGGRSAGGNSGQDAYARAMAAAAAVNSRLGSKGKPYTLSSTTPSRLTKCTAGASSRPTIPTDNRGPDAGAFHSVLEINDFPQSARWKVTNRTNVAKILEATGTSITNKGTFYPPGKEPQAGQEPKLYILVEGDTEVAVEHAMSELTSLLRQGALDAIAKEGTQQSAGRYKV